MKPQVIQPEVFHDFRGEYVPLFRKDKFNVEFVEDDISVSHKNVLRGIHGDFKTWKLISCLYGAIYLVVVDCRGLVDSSHFENFGKWEAFNLNDKNRHQVLIPPGYGNAHLVLTETAIFHYKQSNFYNPTGQFTYAYNYPKFNIRWPIENPITSARDNKYQVD